METRKEKYLGVKKSNLYLLAGLSFALCLICFILLFYIFFMQSSCERLYAEYSSEGGVLSFDMGVITNIPKTEQEIADNCINLSLEKTANCFVSNIKSFYKYKPTHDYLKLSFEEIKEKGGDCYDYSKIYDRLAEKVGFYHNLVDMKIKKYEEEDIIMAHTIAIISNEEGYCIIDGINYTCYKIDLSKSDL
jgi:hypothetical protein